MRPRGRPSVSGNQTRAAQALGIARRTLVYKIRSLDIRNTATSQDSRDTLAEHTRPEDLQLQLKDRMQAIESRIIKATLAKTRGNHSEAARILGIQKRTFDNKARRVASD